MGITVGSAVDIERPVAEVFAFISDLKNWATWMTPLIEIRNVEGDGLGAKMDGVMQIVGRNFETQYEITAYEPNKQILYRGTRPDGDYALRVEARDNGTRLIQEVDLNLVGLVVLAAPVIASMLRRQLQADLDTVKDILETPGEEE
ncbi:MAG: hypothetical protein OHK0046_13710 [Anaerolineae bacterium]